MIHRTQLHRRWKQRKHARILQFPALVNKPNESPLHSRTTTVTTSCYSARHRICIKTNFSSEQTVRTWTFKIRPEVCPINNFAVFLFNGRIAINNPRLEIIIRYFDYSIIIALWSFLDECNYRGLKWSIIFKGQ